MFKSILMPIKLNGPEEWHDAFAVACRLASDHEAKLTLATIIPHWVTSRDADYSWEAEQCFQREAREGLEALRTNSKQGDCGILVHWGSVPSSILDMAEEVDADLVVLPAKNPGICDYLRTQHSVRLASRASCSVLLVKSAPRASP